MAPALGRVVRPAGLSVAIAILYHTLLDFCWGATPREAGPRVSKREAREGYRYRGDAGL